MLFNSHAFIFWFLPAVLLGWWRLRGENRRLLFLTGMSYLFYGWWDWRFIPLMVASTTVDYIAGARIASSSDPTIRKRWLIGSLTFNLAILGVFKYYGFFATSVNAAAARIGAPGVLPILAIVLPVGISFYTFNSMSYTIDIFRRRVSPAKNFLHFSAFVAMFPHLVAGPIVRYSDIENQFARLKTRLSGDQALLGLYLFVAGLAKKLFIADQLAAYVDPSFASASSGFVSAWLVALGYAFQLYFDFSGYSDMAVGLAHVLGIRFPQNFDSPYKAVDVSDFWRRWHISLSTWLRDYLFIPLGGSRNGPLRTVRNLALTMLLGGLWHGAQWTFVAWGLYHGVLLALNAVTNRTRLPVPPWLGRTVTFVAVVFGWMLFRAETLSYAMDVWAAMVGAHGVGPLSSPGGLFLLMLGSSALISFLAPNTWEIDFKPRPVYAYGLAAAFVVAVLLLERASPFPYFQF